MESKKNELIKDLTRKRRYLISELSKIDQKRWALDKAHLEVGQTYWFMTGGFDREIEVMITSIPIDNNLVLGHPVVKLKNNLSYYAPSRLKKDKWYKE